MSTEVQTHTAYINKLAAETGTDISGWDLDAIFGTDPALNDINLKFFAERKKRTVPAAGPSAEPVTISDEVAEAVAKAHADSIVRRIDSLERDVRTNRSRYNDKVQDAQDYLADALRAEQEIATLLNASPNFEGEINKILSTGFWKFDGAEGSALKFSTTRDVTLYDDNHSPRLSVVLGQFSVSYSLDQHRIKVMAHANNTNPVGSSDYIHPHISEEGNICWGRSATLAADLQQSFKIAELFDLLANLLYHYNPNDPYVKLREFRVAQIKANSRALFAEGKLTLEQIKANFHDEGLGEFYQERHYSTTVNSNSDFPFAPPSE